MTQHELSPSSKNQDRQTAGSTLARRSFIAAVATSAASTAWGRDYGPNAETDPLSR